MADINSNLVLHARVINENRAFIVEHLDAEDVIDELIQERIVGKSAQQRVQLVGTSREDKNRIICEQLATAGPGAVNKFCKILRDNIRQTFIAERLEKSFHSATIQFASWPATVKSSALDVKRIKARYLRQPLTSNTGWPKHRVIHYVRLALVDKEDVTIRDESLNEITTLSLQGEVGKILKKKRPLNGLKDIFTKPCPRLILIMGAPGIGKTTLANEICVRWARDGFLAEEFDVVLSIPLRSAQERPVEDVMVDHIGGTEAYEEIKKSAGERCLVIFEGLDEISSERQTNDRFLIHVIQTCTLLEEAQLLITSRPHACEKVNAGRTIEIIGFGDREIRQFVGKSFTNDKTVEEFLIQLNNYPNIRSLCYIPMNLVMIVDVFRVNKKLPSTLTELYKLFIIMIIQRQLKKECEKPLFLPTAIPVATEEMLYKLLNGVPKDAVRTVFVLSRLAYCGFFEWYSNKEEKGRYFVNQWKDPKIIFTTKNLNQCGIEVTTDWDGYGLLKATPTHDVPADTVTYNFAHFTIQEFLCALCMLTLSDQEQLHLLNDNFIDYPNLFIFLCGLTRLVCPATSQFVFQKLKSSSEADILTALQCVYESGANNPPQPMTPLYMRLRYTNLQPYDCVCISHLLSICLVLKLDIKSCHIGDCGAEMFEKNYSGHILQELNLAANDLTVTGMEHVMKIVMKSSASLRVLNVGDNPVGDDGVSLMVGNLYRNTTLNELDVRACKLSAKSAACIGEYLKKNCTLKFLNMSFNPIGDVGMSQLMKGLHQSMSLTELHIRECGLSTVGARYIGEVLINSSLLVLWIGENIIRDDGITAIAAALSKSKIRNLNIEMCDITITGAKNFASALSANETIEILHLYGNPITVEGAFLVLQSAVNNRVCKEVTISDDYKSDSKIKEMLTILQTRRKANKRSLE